MAKKHGIEWGPILLLAAAGAAGCSGGEASEVNGAGPSSGSGSGSGGPLVLGSPGGDGGLDGPSESQGPTPTISGNGCSKVDFLFVVDNSVSMRQEQEALRASFGGFMDALQNTLPTTDYHVMVVDTDAQTKCVPGGDGAGCSTYEDGTMCGGPQESAYACTYDFDSCDMVLGAGVDQPVGGQASNTACDFSGSGENRYLLGDDPNLQEAFSCAAQVGLAGYQRERPIDALVAAISPELNEDGACNAGFLRDDAILVITFISDDKRREDGLWDPSGETPRPAAEQTGPDDWYDAVLNAKSGDPTAVVLLGFFAPSQKHWGAFLERFGDQAQQGPVLEDHEDGATLYNQSFQEVVSLINTTCGNFKPPVVK